MISTRTKIIFLPLNLGLHLIDSYTGVILPFIVSPVAVFFFRQYALGLPKDLLDSARMDGCTEFGIFFRIMAPLMKPAFGAMIILQSLNSWNNFLWHHPRIRIDQMKTHRQFEQRKHHHFKRHHHNDQHKNENNISAFKFVDTCLRI